MSSLDRKSFLGAGLGGTVAAAFQTNGMSATAPIAPTGGRALVLTGGANRGAYQAGVVAGLVEKLGLRDGEPLPYDLVAGTSIGALNGYFIASAQFSRLRDIWLEIPRRHVFRLKPQYAKITEDSSGVGTRLYQALALAIGMLGSVKGVMDQDLLRKFMREFIDPEAPIHSPLYFSSTNMTRQRGQLFCRPGNTEEGRMRQERIDELFASRPMIQRARLADDAILRDALLASATLPIAFEPVLIPRDDSSGKFDEYVDGGVVNNAAVGVAQRTSTLVQVVTVDPPRLDEPDAQYRNSLEIALGLFGIMQHAITNYATLYAYAESILVSDDPNAARLAGFATESLPLRIEFIAPASPLPGEFGDFDDLDSIVQMMEIGKADGLRGWQLLRLSSVIK